MGYDRGNSFPFDFEPNGIPFGSKLKGELSRRSYPIKFGKKWKHSFLSAERQPDRKTVTDKLIAVRETGVSRHQGGPIEGPPETPRTSQRYRIGGFQRGPQSGPPDAERRQSLGQL